MRRDYRCWYSPNLSRNMELLVYGHAGARILVFPTRAGRFFDYENFGMLGPLVDRILAGQLQLFCVDSIDGESLYCEFIPPGERIRKHQLYEDYLLREVLPYTWEANPDSPLIAHGCSLGAYHAVNLAFRHPSLFVKVVGLSGRYDLTVPVPDFRGLFDDYYDDSIYYHTPSHYLPNLRDAELLRDLRRLQVVLAVGRDDPFLENNYHLSHHLREKEVAHELHVWEGRAHCPRRWCQMVPLYV